MKRVLMVMAAGWFCTFMVCGSGVQAETWFAAYDADANTLPDQQGWMMCNDPHDTDPWVADGLLHMDTTIRQYLYWQQPDTYICFPADHGFVVEFELKINSSDYVDISNNRWRTGYSVWLVDFQGRVLSIGIAGSGIILSNDADWSHSYSSPFVSYDTTGGFHTYRFVVQSNIGQLMIDGVPIVSLAVGATNQDTPNLFFFGDATYHAASDTEMTYLRYGLTTEPGDVNGDNEINMVDMSILAQYWLMTGCGCPACCGGADLNHSGSVDLKDFAILANGWLN
jgi:hypothetical protein